MNGILTIAEIQTNFDSEWVLVGQPQTDKALAVLGGRVLWHSKDRNEVYRKAIELHPARFAMLFTGNLAEKTEVVL